VPAGTAAPAPVRPRPEWGSGGHAQPYRVQENVPGRQLAAEAAGAAALLRRHHGGVEVCGLCGGRLTTAK
jgi:hypothetical protein